MNERNICYNCFCEREASEGACLNCGYDPEWGMKKYPLALPHGHVLCDKYILGRVLGQGGYGITYLAIDKWLGTKVAVKEYFPEIGAARTSNTCYVTASSIQKQEEYDKGKADFLQEARVLAAFSGNSNIVKIHGYFEENGTAYFAMDYIEGISFQKYIANQGGKISWNDAYEKLMPIIKALEEVHQKEIIHRDISPDNIYITTDGEIKLLDFGAARFQSLNQSHSLDVVVKHGYAPFEQYNRRGKQGPFTDVYALCACFYAAVTGVLPPDAPERIEEDKLERFSAMGVEVPQTVEAVIFKGLEVKSKDRYQNMTELREALTCATSADAISMDDTTTEETTETQEKKAEKNETNETVPPVISKEDDGVSNDNVIEEATKTESILDKVKALPLKTKQMIAAVCGIVLILCFGVFWFVHPHNYGDWKVVTQVTCLEDGLEERKCFCGDKKTKVINALGHKVVTDSAIPPSCESTGLSEGSHCENCGEVYVAQITIPATGHTIGILSKVDPTCTETGLSEGYGCSKCGYAEKPQAVIDALGHVEVTIPEVSPTCIAEGRTESVVCSVCGVVLVEGQSIPIVSHTLVTDKGYVATCVKEGKTDGSHCSVCGVVIKAQETISKKEHTVVTDAYVKPTCTSDGLSEGSHCSVCKKVIKEQCVVSKLGHDFSSSEKKCSNCGVVEWYTEFSVNKYGTKLTIWCTILSNESDNDYTYVTYEFLDANGNHTGLYKDNGDNPDRRFKSGSKFNWAPDNKDERLAQSGSTCTIKVYSGRLETSRILIGECTFVWT